MFDKIKCSITYSRIECAIYNVENKIKKKVKSSYNYAKEHPVKTTAKVAATVATICIGGKYYTTNKIIADVSRNLGRNVTLSELQSAGLKDCVNNALWYMNPSSNGYVCKGSLTPYQYFISCITDRIK